MKIINIPSSNIEHANQQRSDVKIKVKINVDKLCDILNLIFQYGIATQK